MQLGTLGEQDPAGLVRAHARWDPTDDPELVVWMCHAAVTRPDFDALLRQRLEAGPRDVLLRRMEMDALDHEQACADAAQRPEDPDARYLQVRCMDDGPERDEAFAQGLRDFPDHPWLTLATGQSLGGQGRWGEAPFAGFATGGKEATPEVARLLSLLDVDALREDPTRMAAARAGQDAFMQGQALVMGVVLPGDEAPDAWRREASALLFVPERPRIHTPKEAGSSPGR